MSEKLRARTKDFPDDGNPCGLSPFIRAAAKQIDRDFEHLRPEAVSELIGDLDLASAAARLGKGTVAAATGSISATVRHRVARGTLPSDALLGCIAEGRFPAYAYANIDVIRATRRLGGRTRAPSGLTSCVDEAAMFGALAMTMPQGTVHEIFLLTSSSHTTAIGRDGQGRPFWFYGKNALFSKADWDSCVAGTHGGDIQQAFDDRMPNVNCLLGIEGAFDFTTRESAITPENWHAAAQLMKEFFGSLPSQLEAAFSQEPRFLPPSGFAPIFRRFIALEGRDSFEDFLRAHDRIDDIETDLVAASYRSLQGCDPRAFLIAARNSALRGVPQDSVDSILVHLRALPGRESIFGDRNRIAMPDETLLFGGGSDRDIALLLHVALERLTGLRCVTVMTDADSFVTCGERTWSARTLEPAIAPPEGAARFRFADEI